MEGELNPNILDFLSSLVIEKKELRNIDRDLANEKIISILKRNPRLRKNLSLNKKSRHVKEAVKLARAELREVYGVFIEKDYQKKEKLLADAAKKPSTKIYKKILSLHKSSLERLLFYEEVYKKIFSITGIPKKIADLACGLNPISYSFMGCTPEYFSSDLVQKDCDFLNKYFKAAGINGKAEKIDLSKPEEWEKIPKCDVCFLFKALDSLETEKRNISRALLQKIKCRFAVVSFPKESLGGKKAIKPSRRSWFYKLLKQKNWNYAEFEIPNELFFVVKLKNA